MNEQEFRQALRAEGFAEPVQVERDGTYRLDVHQHPFEAFALIEDGEIVLEVDGVRATYAAGQTFRLAAGTPHREFAGPRGVRYLSGRKGAA